MTTLAFRHVCLLLLLTSLLLQSTITQAANPVQERRKLLGTSQADQNLTKYFRDHAQELANRSLADINDLKTWKEKRVGYRKQLFENAGTGTAAGQDRSETGNHQYHQERWIHRRKYHVSIAARSVCHR